MVNLTGFFPAEDKAKLPELTRKNDAILKKEEEKTRLKSRALWIEVGDKNTQFFHKYASYRKNLNTIWEIQNEDGVRNSSQDNI